MTFDFTLRLIDKENSTPTLVEDLKPFFNSIEYSNTGNERVNNAVLNLDIPSNGKFVRSFPVLIDEFAKVKFLVEFQITQGPNKSKLFRGDIGQPSIIINETGGEVLQIPMNGIEYISKENLYSTQDLLVTAKDHFIQVLNELNVASGLNSGTIFAFTLLDINLPTNFKLNWEPFAPKPHYDELATVIQKLADATVVGGTLRDFYFDFEPSLTTTRLVDVIAEEFGEQSSGVIIDPTEIEPVGGGAGEQGQQQNTDNVKFKNTIIVKGDSGGGSLPMEHARFASEYLHGINREEWQTGILFRLGDQVRVTVVGFPNVRFFTSRIDLNTGNFPLTSPAEWEEDFTIDPVAPGYFSYTPWTEGLTDWLVNSAADRVAYWDEDPNFGSAVGLMVDWNIARTLYDREQPDDYFDRFSVKWVTRISNSEPTAGERFDGQHILVGDNPTGSFAGHAHQICHYNRSESGSIIKLFSETAQFTPFSPVPFPNGTPESADIVMDLSDGKVKKFNGTTFVTLWTLQRGDAAFNPFKSSPFHMIKKIERIDGATGIPDEAMNFFYEWGAPPPFTGDARNFSSNGMWWHMIFPFPREVSDHGGGAIGHEFGQNLLFPMVNTTNLDRTKSGLIGWHRGLASEDMGRMSAFRFKLKTGLFRNQIGEPEDLALGIADLPMVFWAMDKFDRVYFHEFTQRFNNQWQSQSIPIGFGAAQQLHHSRIDEYASIFGVRLPFNFFIPEREFSGIEFDWRFVKMMGIFYKETYDSGGLYIASSTKILRDVFEFFSQLTQEGLAAIQGAFTGQRDTISLDILIRHATLSIDEIYFEKELYASSNEGSVDDPRVEVVREESEQDYLNARALAQAAKARAQFFPQQWNLTATGDVRLKLGQRFKVRSPRVPGGEQEMVVSEIKHTINSDGYFNEIYAIRKFVIPP